MNVTDRYLDISQYIAQKQALEKSLNFHAQPNDKILFNLQQLTMQSADFRWIEKLGTGGYSKVFLAKHLGMKQYWAIKVLKKTDVR